MSRSPRGPVARVVVALVVVLAVVSSAGCRDDEQLTDEPTQSPEVTLADGDTADETSTMSLAGPTTTVETTTTTIADEPTTRSPPGGEWVEVAVDEPWVDSVGALEAMPGGGYVAVLLATDEAEAAEQQGSSPSTVMWSPDGVEWSDGDPDREIDRLAVDDHDLRGAQLAVTRNRVVIVDGVDLSDRAPLAVGDPRTGVWNRVALDDAAIEGRAAGVEAFSFAADDDEVLVAAYSAPSEPGSMDVVTWVVDPVRETSETSSFRIAATARQDDDLLDRPTVASVDGRWILIAFEDVAGPDGDESRNTLWTSSDGLVWSQSDLPDGMGGVYSMATGPTGVAAAACTWLGPGADGGDREGIWHSTDGLDWAGVPGWAPGHQTPVIDVGEYGFVIMGGESGVVLSAGDGSEVHRMAGPFHDVDAAASSGNTLLIHALERGQLWLYSPQ